MRYVYILQSRSDDSKFYTGITSDIRLRLKRHNAGEIKHTSKYLPWELKTYLAFTDREKAYEFEQYLKSGSGRAFAKRRL